MNFRLAWIAPCLVVALWGGVSARAERPNILFLFADDQCYETIRALGLNDVDTPNLDRLMARGTIFTHAYNMGSWSPAVCIASRAMLVTGRSVWRAQNVVRNLEAERTAGRLWPQLMAQAGYRTYFTGKWHIATDANRCFDVTQHIRAGMPGTVPSAYHRPILDQPDAWSPFDVSLGGFWQGGRHWSEVTADDAIEFISATRPKEQPFFAYVAFNAPHDPRQAPREYVERYPPERVALPVNFQSVYPHCDAIGCSAKLRDESLAPHPRTEHSVRVHRGEYFALISHLDAQIGRILEALERSGQAERTWIFFTADHGLAVGQHGLFGKQNMYDHSLRVPFLVAGPGVPRNARRDAPIYLQDVMATSLDLAGVDAPQVEFQSLVPHLRGDIDPPLRSAIYGAYLQLQRAVLADGWKLIVYPEAPAVRLYDLTNDPRETVDRAEDPDLRDRQRSLAKRLLALQAELDDPLDLRPCFTQFGLLAEQTPKTEPRLQRE